MEVFVLAALAALVVKFIDFFKFLTNKEWSAAITQVSVWLAGVLGLVLFAATSVAEGVHIGETLVSDMNFMTLLMVGMSVGATGSFGYDIKRALDQTDSAVTGPLVPSLAVTKK